MQSLRSRVSGILATALLTAFAASWTFWSFAELYYEGWGMPFPQPLAYLIPFAVALALGAAALAWPRLMGAVIIVASVASYGWAVSMNLSRWGFSWGLVLSWSGMAALTLVGGAGGCPARGSPTRKRRCGARTIRPSIRWTSEQSPTDAWFVNYQAFVSHQPKGFGNPRHGYRCVKDPGR